MVEEGLFFLYGFLLRLDLLAIKARKSSFSIYGSPLSLDFLVIGVLAFIQKNIKKKKKEGKRCIDMYHTLSGTFAM